ncbi:sulfatase-like hydrolase/transferase [Fulvivirgaceae bacterium BMA10]|uniref:Sulfatase-like hydrolase/transferase n=1 Tax=Splendidivirga corallicola TaxID=3051826 RepID=A0ABT8KUE2_9BACT|nr:sulfatase-like hydrolase/transferase [Fulvivirgaceae bacterium BMA10]
MNTSNNKFKEVIKAVPLDWSIYSALIIRLLIAMLLFSLCRIGFYLVNQGFFPGMEFGKFTRIMWGGLKFDLSAILYINLLFIFFNLIPFKFRTNVVYQRVLKYLFFVTNGIGLAANCGDFIYYQFILKRTTSSVFEAFAGEGQMGGLFVRFLFDYWYVTLTWIGLIVLMVFLYNKVKIVESNKRFSFLYFLTSTAVMLGLAYLIVGGIRGGFRHSTRPITLNNAGKYVEKPNEMAIVLNTPFCLIRTIDKPAPKKVKFFETDEALTSVFDPVQSVSDTAAFRKENVMVIILESFGREYFGTLNQHLENGAYKGYTPFLDSLIQHSYTFQNSFANGHKSIDALPSVTTSIPAFQYSYVLSHYSGNKINSIASLLGEKGYHTAYLYGGPNGSLGYESFVNIAGFDEYVGMNEYGNSDDYDGIWGIWDEEFFQFSADNLNRMPEPFCSVLMSVSSHHPFKVPEKHEGRFDKGKVPLHQCIGYTDHALKRFFQKVSKMPWYKNTLFVITADHTSVASYPEYRTSVGVHAVPIILFKPGSDLVGRKDYVVQQADVMPTVLNYLNYDGSFVSFGNDMLNDSTRHFALNYTGNAYQLIQNEHVLQFDGERVVGLYNYQTDRLLLENLAGKKPEVEKPMENLIKAIVQQYNTRMIDDNMTVN